MRCTECEKVFCCVCARVHRHRSTIGQQTEEIAAVHGLGEEIDAQWATMRKARRCHKHFPASTGGAGASARSPPEGADGQGQLVATIQTITAVPVAENQEAPATPRENVAQTLAPASQEAPATPAKEAAAPIALGELCEGHLWSTPSPWSQPKTYPSPNFAAVPMPSWPTAQPVDGGGSNPHGSWNVAGGGAWSGSSAPPAAVAPTVLGAPCAEHNGSTPATHLPFNPYPLPAFAAAQAPPWQTAQSVAARGWSSHNTGLAQGGGAWSGYGWSPSPPPLPDARAPPASPRNPPRPARSAPPLPARLPRPPPPLKALWPAKPDFRVNPNEEKQRGEPALEFCKKKGWQWTHPKGSARKPVNSGSTDKNKLRTDQRKRKQGALDNSF